MKQRREKLVRSVTVRRLSGIEDHDCWSLLRENLVFPQMEMQKARGRVCGIL